MRPAWGIVAFEGRDGLRRLEADWNRLLATMPERAFHHTYESHVAYFDHLSVAGGRYTCLALTDVEQVRAICPLELRTASILGRRTWVWGLPWDLQILLRDVICPPDEARDALLPSVVGFLQATRARPRWLVLDRMLEGSALWQCLPSLGSRAYVTDVSAQSDLFDCTAPYETLSEGFSRKFRANLRSAHRKLGSLADVHFVHAVDPQSVAREFEAFLDLEAAGWKGAAGSGTAIRLNPRLVAYYRALTAMSGDPGRCEINALYAEGRCIASQFCAHTGEEYSLLKLCYDERYPRVAPGQLLLERTLERCCADPQIKRLSLVSHQEWHQDWRPQTIPVHCLYVGLGRWSGPAVMRGLRLRFGLARRAKKRLQRLAVVSKSVLVSAIAGPQLGRRLWRRARRDNRNAGEP